VDCSSDLLSCAAFGFACMGLLLALLVLMKCLDDDDRLTHHHQCFGSAANDPAKLEAAIVKGFNKFDKDKSGYIEVSNSQSATHRSSE
jgi:hypothetical protein